jgi:hypothetical protein
MEYQNNNNPLKSSGNMLVVCRARPMIKQEIEMGSKNCLDLDKNQKNLTLNLSNEQSR